MKREKRIIITLSTDEWEAIKASADRCGLSVASFLRQSALNAIPREKKEEGK